MIEELNEVLAMLDRVEGKLNGIRKSINFQARTSPPDDLINQIQDLYSKFGYIDLIKIDGYTLAYVRSVLKEFDFKTTVIWKDGKTKRVWKKKL